MARRGTFPRDEREHGYDWLDSTVAQDLSPDGKTLLFAEIEPGRKNAMSYVRKTDGSPAVPLGEGFCSSLSPDGKWALCSSGIPLQNLKLVSTSGETRQLPNGASSSNRGPAGVGSRMARGSFSRPTLRVVPHAFMSSPSRDRHRFLSRRRAFQCSGSRRPSRRTESSS